MCLPDYSCFVESDNLTEQTKVIDDLFEPSYSILRFTLRDGMFMQNAKLHAKNYAEFIELIRSRLLNICNNTEQIGPSSRDVDHLADIVGAHPRLGESAKKLSASSKKEQQKLQNNNDPIEIREMIAKLNNAYEKKYPGLRFVVFVNGRSRPQIIRDMQRRIESGNSWFEEARIAINELCDIAQDRVSKGELQSLKCKY